MAWDNIRETMRVRESERQHTERDREGETVNYRKGKQRRRNSGLQQTNRDFQRAVKENGLSFGKTVCQCVYNTHMDES